MQVFNLSCDFTESGESGFSTTYCRYPKRLRRQVLIKMHFTLTEHNADGSAKGTFETDIITIDDAVPDYAQFIADVADALAPVEKKYGVEFNTRGTAEPGKREDIQKAGEEGIREGQIPGD